MKAALYARVSTSEQQTLPMQLETMREYAAKRGWTVKHEIEEIGSGAKTRPKREELLKLARQRKVDVIIVWRLDRWGRSLADLIVSLKELTEIGVGFVSLTGDFRPNPRKVSISLFIIYWIFSLLRSNTDKRWLLRADIPASDF